jgi:hypothetical protein
MSVLGPDMSNLGGYIWQNCWICPVHIETFFSTLILETRGTNLDTRVTSTHGTSFQRGFFPNPKISLLILDELKDPRFQEKWEKSIKSKGLEPWIHSKIGGR